MPSGIGGELAWWCPSLDDSGNGTTTLNDLTGNGNTGTFQTMTSSAWVSDTSNGGIRALQFSAGGHWVNCGSGLNSFDKSAWTTSSWFYADSDFSNSAGIVNRGSLSTQNTQWAGDLNSNRRFSAIVAYSTGFKFSNSANFSYSNTTWTHLIHEYALDSDELRIYKNGTLHTTFTGITGNFANPGHSPIVAIGRLITPFSYYFLGKLDDIRVFDSLLSSTQKANLASARGYQPAATLFPRRRRSQRGAFAL